MRDYESCKNTLTFFVHNTDVESRLPFLVIGFLFFIMIDHDQNDDYSVFLDTADNLTEIKNPVDDGD